MICVTTFSETGYAKYGKRFLESAIKYWPGDIVAYYEKPFDLEDEKLIKRYFFEIEGAVAFYQYLKNVPMAQGKVEGGYAFNYDAWKFTRKVFAQYDTLVDGGGKIFWIDADCQITKPISTEFLESLFDGKCLAYLGREGLYTETGFIGFDTGHKECKSFLQMYISMLRRGTIFTLERWHDCQVFDTARELSRTSGNNLSSFWKIPESRIMSLEDLDVMSKSVLGEYIIHDKGPRKNRNISRRTEEKPSPDG